MDASILPPKHGAIRFQSADQAAILPYIGRHGFHVVHVEQGGDCIARRDFDRLGGELAEEPAPPRRPFQVVTAADLDRDSRLCALALAIAGTRPSAWLSIGSKE